MRNCYRFNSCGFKICTCSGRHVMKTYLFTSIRIKYRVFLFSSKPAIENWRGQNNAFYFKRLIISTVWILRKGDNQAHPCNILLDVYGLKFHLFSNNKNQKILKTIVIKNGFLFSLFYLFLWGKIWMSFKSRKHKHFSFSAVTKGLAWIKY